MKYFLIAGEASGDLHASNLMKELARQDPDAEFRFMGGDLMHAVSGKLVMHYRDTSYMMLDVIFHLGKIFRNLSRIKSEIKNWRPDVVIPVDYPGFNLRIARFAKSRGLKVYYFISPKVWAWRQQRIKKLKSFTDHLFVIFPFEVDFFRQFGIEAEYFGNPLVDALHEFFDRFEGSGEWLAGKGLEKRPVVALLAGSRKKEIEATLPVMLEVASQHTDYQFVVAGAPSIEASFYDKFLSGKEIGIVFNETYELLASAYAAMVNSGTATLETALFGVPQVILYKTGTMAYLIAKRLIKINFISLVNLIIGRGLVLEIIQKDLYSSAGKEVSKILNDSQYRDQMIKGYRDIQSQLGERGVSKRIGRRMIDLLNEESV